MGIETVIHLNKFQPRDYQIPICRALEGYTDSQCVHHKPMKRIMIILPRRAGKDLICFNLMFRQALKRVGTYFYVLPTFSSARRILWDNITIQGQKLLDYIPSELIKRKNEQQMRIEFVNGSVLQLIGSDTYNNTLVGTNPVGIIFSEFGITDERAYHFSKPILSANDGWVIINGTPRGDKNYFYILREIARQNPDEWFWYEKTVDETRHMDIEEIYRDIARGEISYDHARQEYWCDWHIGQQGCIYNDYLNKMRLENRITMVPYETSHPVYTAWDLGVMDKTVILFFQKIGTAIRIIDSYSNTDKGLDHYAKILAEKGYNYGINPIHVAPHDIAHRDIATSGALSRIEIARSLGIRFTIAPRLSVEDGIEAGKILFSRLWIDEEHNKDFISALGEYRREYDIVNKVYRKTPLHNWASDWADAYRYLAISQKIITADNYTPEDLERNFRQSHYPQNNIPLPLQDRY